MKSLKKLFSRRRIVINDVPKPVLCQLQVVFVYDTNQCQREEDDPRDAILYFYPTEASDDHRVATCGQLMGVTQFFANSFSCPQLISLQDGKFVIRPFGQFLLVVGCSSITPDSLVKQQTEVLTALVQFYHKDLDTIHKSVNGDRERFESKLALLFDTYLNVLQCNGDLFSLMFGVVPSLSLPKSAKTVFLEASLILQSCQQQKGVLGGVVLFQNKVVGTRLTASMTKKVVSYEPHQTHSPAEFIQTTFRPPIGVRLFRVYVSEVEFRYMQKNSSWYKNVTVNVSSMKKKTVRLQDWEKPTRFQRCDAKTAMPITEEDEEVSKEEVTAICDKADTEKNVPETLASVVHKLSDYLDANGTVCDVNSNDVSNERKLDETAVTNGTTAENDIIRYGTNSWDRFANKSFSLDDLRETASSSQNPFRFFSFGLPPFGREKDDCSCKRDSKFNFRNSIADPWSPIFRSDGVVVSKYLYEEFVAETANLWRGMMSPAFERSVSEELLESNVVPKKPEVARPSSLQVQKQALTLPLNKDPLTTRPNGVVITPLESPAMFAMPRRDRRALLFHEPTTFEECKPSICTPDFPFGAAFDNPTPNGSGDNHAFLDSFKRISVASPMTPKPFPTSASDSSDRVDKEFEFLHNEYSSDGTELYSVALYAQLHMNMLLLLLLEEDYSKDPEVIHSLWENGLATLGNLESSIRHCQEQSGGHEQSDPYSYLNYESCWGTLSRGGREDNMNVPVVQTIHESFTTRSDITEVSVRCEDHVVYAQNCGAAEVFYQQSTGPKCGLPMPSDLMGKVPLRARRRLERDHNIVIL